MNYIAEFLREFAAISAEMAPFLLLGFLFAGILHVFFPKERMERYLGRGNAFSVLNAAIVGVPLPLCSCGVIPAGISFYRNGSSKGAAVSFLISTPQTGVDSILVTWSLLGLPFALLRPVIAFVTGVFGGIITRFADPEMEVKRDEPVDGAHSHRYKNPFRELFKYAFVDFLQDISKWLIMGLLVAALVSMVVPDDFFVTQVKSGWLSMLIVLFASVPLYVCATSSVPVAAVLMMKGLSPGAALVFLMAGPATNAATITVIGKVMGKKTLFIYLISIIGGALLFGTVIDLLLPREWFSLSSMSSISHASHGILPIWMKYASALLLALLIINGYVQRRRRPAECCSCSDGACQTRKEDTMKKLISVKGMSCNHCKMSVEKNLSALEGISRVSVDLSRSIAVIEGDDIDLAIVAKKLEEIGFEFDGER